MQKIKGPCPKSYGQRVEEPGLKPKQPGSKPHAFTHSTLLPPQTQKGYDVSKYLDIINLKVRSRQTTKQRETVKEQSNAFFLL